MSGFDIKSVETLMSKVTIEDSSPIVDAVKANGRDALVGICDTLKTTCEGSNNEAIAAALKTISALATETFPVSQAYVLPLLPVCLNLTSSKDKNVREFSGAAAKDVCASMSPSAASIVLPMLFASMDSKLNWQQRVVALDLVCDIQEHAPEQLGYALPDVVPVVTPCIQDTKKQVKEAGARAMTAACDVIGNRDIEHMTSNIVLAVQKPAQVPEIMHKLAGVTFVQSVESPALAMVVPLLLRGLRERKIATQRQAAVIIDNMSKLVDNPVDAAPFLPLLLPQVKKCADSCSDPEAREIVERAVGQLERLQGLIGDRQRIEAVFADVLKLIKDNAGKYPKDAESEMELCANLACSLMNTKQIDAEAWTDVKVTLSNIVGQAQADKALDVVIKVAAEMMKEPEVETETEEGEVLCDCQFTLAYGTKILLHNTKMKLIRGKNYGLLGGNDSGKTTLMRSIANGSVEGFPDASEVRTVFVEADIQGELSHLSCIDYVFEDPAIQALGIEKQAVQDILATVGFTQDGKAKPNHAVSTLSGGWRMKLALARAMLQRADILLLDEPTNHLDVINVAWVKNYLNSLTNVTCIMVSHDSGLLNDCCSHILQIKNLKLDCFRGNLDAFVKEHPEAKSFFELKASKLKFNFPQPGPIPGIKSKGKALMKMAKCDFTYPGNEKPTLYNITIQVSLASRVACVGENGAGKSTMIKVLTGEVVPQTGDVWSHPNARVAYVAQHAFHHIEAHLDKTPNEYIRWRYANNGEDKESLVKLAMQFTPEEEKLQKEQFEYIWVDQESGKQMKRKDTIIELVGGRRQKGKDFEYETKFRSGEPEFVNQKVLKARGFEKNMKAVDARIAQAAGILARPLSSANVEKHLGDVGLEAEFASHYRMSALSGGQKVKVVLAAAMWNQPHILILDEPTNYLDREALGALATAINEFGGGVVIISHNNEFCKTCCNEEWIMDAGHLTTKGEAGWMERQDEKISDQQQITEMTDASGNTVKIKVKKTLSKREEKAMIKKVKAMIKNGDELDEEEYEFAMEKDLFV
jgi:elongation factor 3